MSQQTYQAIADAIQAHLIDEYDGAPVFAAHWAMAVGVDSLDGFDESVSTIQVFKSGRTPIYAVTGLFEFGARAYYDSGEVLEDD
jgi:hypothetical protein